MSPRRLVLLGRGIAFEAWQLAEHLGVRHLSMGEMMRRHTDGRSALGQQLTAALADSQPLSDDLVREVITHALSHTAAASDGWLLENFPRTSRHARWLDNVLGERGTPLTAALVANTPGSMPPELDDVIAYYGDRVELAGKYFD